MLLINRLFCLIINKRVYLDTQDWSFCLFLFPWVWVNILWVKRELKILFETRRKNTGLFFWIFKTWQEICISMILQLLWKFHNKSYSHTVCVLISPYKSKFWHYVAQAPVVKASSGCNSTPESEYAKTDRLFRTPCYITYLISIVKLPIIKSFVHSTINMGYHVSTRLFYLKKN